MSTAIRDQQGLAALALPPARMPHWQGARPLKQWRYLGMYGADLMLCIGAVRVGPVRQSFWSVWDRRDRRLYGHTQTGSAGVSIGSGAANVRDRGVTIDLTWDEQAGIEAVAPSGASYAWTRKQGGVAVTGAVSIGGEARPVEARAVIDDTAAYYPRHTTWWWSAGVGRADDGREVAWNLVRGVNDSAANSERTVWVGGEAQEPPPSEFADDLSGVDELVFASEAVRENNENYAVLRSRYRQPFGTFAGTVGGVTLAEGYGVMEHHDAHW